MNDIDIEFVKEILTNLEAESNLFLNMIHKDPINITGLKDCALAIDNYVSELKELWEEEKING